MHTTGLFLSSLQNRIVNFNILLKHCDYIAHCNVAAKMLKKKNQCTIFFFSERIKHSITSPIHLHVDAYYIVLVSCVIFIGRKRVGGGLYVIIKHKFLAE